MRVLDVDVDAVLFDLDGTLLDSERAICESAVRAFADVGAHVHVTHVAEHMGAPLHELFASCMRPPHVDDHDLRARFVQRYLEHHDVHPERHPRVLPGALQGVSALFARGLRTALATTKPTDRAQEHVRVAGLSHYLHHVQGTDVGMRPKPSPDVLHAALQALGVHPSRALMVGDTLRDVDAAHAAGMRAVVVTYSSTHKERAHRFGAHRVVDSLLEL